METIEHNNPKREEMTEVSRVRTCTGRQQQPGETDHATPDMDSKDNNDYEGAEVLLLLLFTLSCTSAGEQASM